MSAGFLAYTFYTVIVVLLSHTTIFAQVSWESITSFGTVRRFLPIADTVYAVTSGGLLKIVDPNVSPRRFTNLDGFGTVDLFDMVRDVNGTDWIAAAGRVIRRIATSVRQFPLLDLDNNLFDAISLADDGNRLWVGTAIGLIVIDKSVSGGQVVEFYDRFGSLNPGAAVNDIILTGDSIWLATNSGLAVARRTDLIVLNAPGSWSAWNVSDYSILGSDTIRCLALYNDSIYLGTSRGAFTFDRSVDPPVVRQNSFTTNQIITDLVVSRDTLFLLYQDGMVTVVPGMTFFNSPFGLSRTMTTTGTRQWFGRLNGTIGYSDVFGSAEYDFIGLPTNDIVDVAFSKVSGVTELNVIAGNAGVYRRDGDFWTTLFAPPGWSGNNLISISDNQLVAAIEGGGIVVTTDTQSVRYDTSATTLRGVSEGPNFIPVRDISLSDGVLFAACYRAFNTYPIAFVRSGQFGTRSAWDSLGIGDGIFDNFVISVAALGEYLAVGTEANGIFVCNLGPDPFNKDDDNCVLFNETSGNLVSNAVRVVRFSPSGELWIGTNLGLSRLDPSIETRATDVNLPIGFGPDITDLEFDSRGTLWLGAANGLARLDIANATYTTYTTLNSPLLSDNIRALSIDPFSNDLYLSTPNGISVARSGTGILTDDFNNLLASPNPFIVDGSGHRLRFNSRASGELAIFTNSGDLVYTSAILEWNGRNSSGQLVASGVYLFTITDESGQSGRGKFLLVRQ